MYSEREFNEIEDYDWITKRMIFWDWMCRKSSYATVLRDLWLTEAAMCMDERQIWESEEILYYTWIVSWRLLRTIRRKGFEKLKQQFTRQDNQNRDTTSMHVSGREVMTEQRSVTHE